MNPPWPKGKKLVHLDLKGAPPRIEYLHQLIELFSRLGVDGLLVEYEDMFPYEGELQLLQATVQPAYSREQVLSIQESAKARGMEVIPLVQTFGHMEFVLKHRTLWHLREVPHCIGTLNPHKEDGVKMVMEMLRQVVELHPHLRTVHIGADEVYSLGEGEDSKLWLASTGHSVEQLFLSHVTKVAKAIKEAWPDMNIIMWDDMMRGMSQDTLKASGLVGLVQPMLWDYTPNLDVDKTVSLLEKYHGAGMSDLWAASSFKGSTSVHTCVTCTQRHVDNHLQWLKVASSLSAAINMRGIAITGWQRYDHLSVLCELLPVALPSLASCLQTLNHGEFSTEAHRNVTEMLGVSSVEIEAMERTSADESLFPGRRLAELIVEINSLLNSEDLRFFESNMFVRGWFSPYHRQRKMVNPLNSILIHSQASEYLDTLQKMVEAVRKEMVNLYPDSTAEEWMEEHVSPVTAPLQRIIDAIPGCVKEMVP
ncbi:PREDICTED: hexosaminidase D isoform X1 [Poecilia mexicana]|uniref:beta-N-acetylhexosaminidase n=1 Tax=Poecilia mexicana TaxID=48701 RepID=A0A3B3WML4_9TELE|nr:PREDICTED: hexosaminidase D isoform X1 [Poecilia mexicana]XP_014857804.1 PREDICTED: hexosaminidase D isoform X1 [Poecilia mexicana]